MARFIQLTPRQARVIIDHPGRFNNQQVRINTDHDTIKGFIDVDDDAAFIIAGDSAYLFEDVANDKEWDIYMTDDNVQFADLFVPSPLDRAKEKARKASIAASNKLLVPTALSLSKLLEQQTVLDEFTASDYRLALDELIEDVETLNELEQYGR